MIFKALAVSALSLAVLSAQTWHGAAALVPVDNDTSTGTTLYTLAKLTSQGRAVTLTTSDTSGVIGIVQQNAGTSSRAGIAEIGQASCLFDGATTAGDYVQASSSIAGNCHDAGASFPSSGTTVVGRVLSTNGSAGTYNVFVFPAEIKGATPSWGSISGTLTNQPDLATALSGKLADPGANGIVKRTALGATSAAIGSDLPTGYPYSSVTGTPTLGTAAAMTGPVGAIVGTTDTQTLTNKTLDGVSPTTMGYLDATSSIQAQLNGKQSTGSYLTANQPISLSGDATGSGATSLAVTVPKINGTSVPTNSAADQALLTTGAATGSWASVPTCLDSGGQHLNYNTSTHAFSCGTTGGTAGSAAFNTLTSGTNTSAAMVVGTGATLGATGSGTITANALSGVASSALSDGAAIVKNAQANTYLNQAAPSTPATGNVAVWTDSTDKNLKAKNDAGIVSITIQPASAATHQFVTAISSAGAISQAQPVAADVSGLSASATTDTTNASNISSGTLSAARLPNPSATTLGGVESITASSHKWMNAISTSGVPSQTQPAAADLSDGTTGTGAVVMATTPSLSNPSVGTTGVTVSVTNAASTGTTVNKLVKLTGAPSTGILASTSDTTGVVGIVVSGAGTAGSAQVARTGEASCVFDGATTAGDYVQISSTTGGDCHDTGNAVYPTSGGQVLGRVLSTNASAGTFVVVLAGSDLQAATSSVGAPVWSKYTIGYGAVSSGATTATVNIATLSANQAVCGLIEKTSTAFAGTSISALSVTVGDSADTVTPATTYAPKPYDAIASVSNTNFAANNVVGLASFAGGTIQANFTSTGANLSALASGSIDFRVCVVTLP